jgi:Fe-S-cluster containining protein
MPLPLVRLGSAAGGKDSAATTTAHLRLSIGGQRMAMEISVPVGPTQPGQLLPVLQDLTDVVVGIAVQNVEWQGQVISCRKGCGACCRQLVPLSESEARALAQLVDALPEPRRSHVRARFAEARRRLDAAGLGEQLRQPGAIEPSALHSLGLAYFQLGLACPFLEDESCSIHRDRPLACREYLVTSPAENCARPSADTVRMVPLPVGVAGAVRAVDRQPSASAPGWVPLVFALDWAAEHPEEPPARSGPALLKDLFERLTGGRAPQPVPAKTSASKGGRRKRR